MVDYGGRVFEWVVVVAIYVGFIGFKSVQMGVVRTSIEVRYMGEVE